MTALLDALDGIGAELESIDTSDPAGAATADSVAARLDELAATTGSGDVSARLAHLAVLTRDVAARIRG